MNNAKTGNLIKSLRLSKKLTQLQLGEMLSVSDKTVSKWERGLGMPDVSLISKLAEILGVSAERILSGKADKNNYNGGNINRLQFMYCTCCGNVVATTAKMEGSCCGNKLVTLEKEKNDSIVTDVEIVEDEYFVTLDSPMTKENFVTFVALKSYDKYVLMRLYPEQNPQIRVPMISRGEFYVGLNDGKLYSCQLDKIFLKKSEKST